MTDAERKLWWHLRRISLNGSHFRRQATIGPYFVDFACHDIGLVIEVDGGQHNENAYMTADAARTRYLHSFGYRTLRFWNNEVLGNVDGVLTVIQAAVNDALSQRPPLPTPPHRATRGGRGDAVASASQHTGSESIVESECFAAQGGQP